MVNTDITNSGQYKMTLDNKDSSLDMVNNINGKFTNIQSILSSLQTEIDRSISSTSQSQSSINTMMTKLTNLNNRIKNINNKLNSNSGGKRTARFIIGTSTSGWTLDDCDYLCNGSNDSTIIQSAIDSLPSHGGEIKLLDGTYNNIDLDIQMKTGKSIKISGCDGTILKSSGIYPFHIYDNDTKNSYCEICFLTFYTSFIDIKSNNNMNSYNLNNLSYMFINLHDINIYDALGRSINADCGCVNFNRINIITNLSNSETGRKESINLDAGANDSLLSLFHNCSSNLKLVTSTSDIVSLRIDSNDNNSLVICTNNNILGHCRYCVRFSAYNSIFANNIVTVQAASGEETHGLKINLASNSIIMNNMSEIYLYWDLSIEDNWSTMTVSDTSDSDYNIVALNSYAGTGATYEYQYNNNSFIDNNKNFT